VVRESDDPIDLSDNDDYLTTLVGIAPLVGTTYVADRCQIHQSLTGKVLGEQAEEWICDSKNKQMVVCTLSNYVYTLKEKVMFHAKSLKLKQFIQAGTPLHEILNIFGPHASHVSDLQGRN
jgi:hypothetical protein